MHSSRMHNTRSLPGGGISVEGSSWTEAHLNRDPPDRDPPGQRRPWTETPPVNLITDMCENITFSQLRLWAVKMDFCTGHNLRTKCP